MKTIIYDAESVITGRLGSIVAKDLLKGKTVVVLNAEKAIITGDRGNIAERWRVLRKKGGSSQKGPVISRMPDRLLKRMIRGMLPWDRTKGREAYKRLRCYTSKNLPKDLKIGNVIKFETEMPLKFTTIKEIADLL